MPALSFEVGLPNRALSSNARGSWHRRASATSDYRTEAKLMAFDAVTRARWVTADRVSVRLEFGTKGARRVGGYAPRDEQNALSAAKALIDGMVDAGVVVDDSRDHLTLAGTTISRDWGPGVRVIVERVA